MKVKVTLLCAILTAMLALAIYVSVPQATQGQKKSTAHRSRKPSVTVGVVSGLRIISVEPLPGAGPVPMSVVTAQNVSERPIAAVWITDGYNARGEVVSLRRITFYEEEDYLAPGETFQLSPTEASKPQEFTAIVYADGSAEGKEAEARELAGNHIEYLGVTSRLAARLAAAEKSGNAQQSATAMSNSVREFIAAEKTTGRKTSGGLDALNAIERALNEDATGAKVRAIALRHEAR